MTAVIEKGTQENAGGALSLDERGEREPRGEREGDGPGDFIREIVQADVRSGKHQGRVVTRFPPEPNGYLHIGHAKSICLNFGLARDFKGVSHLRFDDTNPTTEDVAYVESIQRDVKWLGFDWNDKLFYASDYFERLYAFAVQLIKAGRAYVCSLNEEEIRKLRGTVTEPGTDSPYRSRSVAENLDLLQRMRAGEFPDGAHVVRAKIDMASPNMKMRDPPIYRIRHAKHYRTGDAWCLYPLYDYTHCLSDWIEGITHSICTLEFENNRELYDWVLEAVEVPNRPRQIEFARLNLTYTVMSKRRLLQLVEGGHVTGWDDPRMPTLAGMRRRGYTPEAIRDFCERIGVAKSNSVVEVQLLEHYLREDLNVRSPRVLCVLRPLRVVIENYPEGQAEELEAPFWPPDVPKEGSRKLPFSRVVYIDRDDFMEEPPKDYHRLAPGREVRLRYAYIIKCTGVVKDPATGEVTEIRATYDPATKSEGGPGGRKVKGTIHWVSADHAADVEVRLYDRLVKSELPASGSDFIADLSPDSLVTLRGCKLEPSAASAQPGDRFQFERAGFFFVDPIDSKPGAPVWNRTVALKDSWAKIAKAASAAGPGAPAAEKPPAAQKKAERDEKPKQPARAEGSAAKAEAAPLSPEAEELRERHGLTGEDAKILAGDPGLRAFFDEAIAAHPNAKAIANWIVNDVAREVRGGSAADLPFRGAALGELVSLIDAGTISGKIAKDVFAELRKSGGSPKAIVERQGIQQIADASTLEPLIDAVLAENADAVARYKAGNANLLGALVGMVMKKTGGKASPKLLNEILKKKLS